MRKSALLTIAAGAIAAFVQAAPLARAADEPTVLITGSSRGIGFEITRVYAERGWNVIATCRTPSEAEALQELAAEHDNIAIEELDVTDHIEIDALAQEYKSTPIDILLNNAGISGGSENQKFGELNYPTYNTVMDVNVLGPLKMAEAFVDHVAVSTQKKIINISSTQGSITSNFGGQYFYRASKAALNMVMRTLAIELKDKGITVGILAPGFVRTDFTKGIDLPIMINPDESAAAVVAVIDDYTFEDTGTFIKHTGEESPW